MNHKLLWVMLFIFQLLYSSNMSAKGNDFLNDNRWQYRILLINQSSDESSKILKQAIKNDSEAFKTRKFKVIMFDDTKAECVLGKCSELQLKDIQHFRIPTGKMMLIGLDGTSKAVYPANAESINMVFSDVDKMPMRRAELTRHDKK